MEGSSPLPPPPGEQHTIDNKTSGPGANTCGHNAAAAKDGATLQPRSLFPRNGWGRGCTEFQRGRGGVKAWGFTPPRPGAEVHSGPQLTVLKDEHRSLTVRSRVQVMQQRCSRGGGVWLTRAAPNGVLNWGTQMGYSNRVLKWGS